MLRRLYDWTVSLAAHRRSEWALSGVAFVESSVFPIPPDALLIPMVFARPEKAWRYALICTIMSVLGGIAGYAIGFFLFESIGQAIVDFYGLANAFDSFQNRYNESGVWIVLIAGLTPFPYKVITIASGVTALNFAVFVAASVLARGLRFFIVAALLWKFGPSIRGFIEKWLGWVFAAGLILLIGGFAVVKYVL